MRYGVTARRKRNMRRVGLLARCARISASTAARMGKVKIAVSEAELSGKLVAEAERVSKSFGDDADRARLLDPHPARRPHRAGRAERRRQDHAAEDADRRARAGRGQDHARREPADGDARSAARDARSECVRARHADRRARRLGVRRRADAPRRRLHEGFSVRARSRPAPPVAALSGGERGRLTLARALAKPSNLLVLDEPTNDLDLETLDLLEEMIDDYPGHGAARLARPRFPRPHRVGRRGRGRRRALERLCRRLHRHGGAARRRRDREGGENGAEDGARESRGTGPPRPGVVFRSRTSTRSKRCPRASRRSKPRSRSSRRRSPIPTSTPATAPPSTRRPRRSARRRPNSPRPRTNGCGWRNCGSRWRRGSCRCHSGRAQRGPESITRISHCLKPLSWLWIPFSGLRPAPE